MRKCPAGAQAVVRHQHDNNLSKKTPCCPWGQLPAVFALEQAGGKNRARHASRRQDTITGLARRIPGGNIPPFAMTQQARARLVLGNWKMHGSLAENELLLAALRAADTNSSARSAF